MNFTKAFEALKAGYKIKLAHWSGYWKLENGKVIMHCKDGRDIDLQDSEDILYTLSAMASDEWEVLRDDYEIVDITSTMRFGEALRKLKSGKKVARKGWNGKGMFVVYQKGYPDGIPCNQNTADAWGLKVGDPFKCEPYLQIKMTNGSHAMWVPSINDVLSEDWGEVE